MSDCRFPEGFVWGAATASYQIEGAVRTDGRGESIWDRFSHTPGKINNGNTGDLACDHYHRYEEDVALMAGLGLDAYRFSVSWPRVIPNGIGPVNQAGLAFYDRLVDELLENGIAPHVTLYHWDLPQAPEEAGGWPVRSTAEAFAEYAGIVADRLADRVTHFATINEPYVVSHLGYRLGIHAPGRREPEAALATAHHLLVAHGLAVERIRSAAPNTAVGIVLNFDPQHAASGHPLDLEAAHVNHDHSNRWFLDPVTGRGYPADGAKAWGWKYSEVLDGDLALIAAPIDFLGVNYYSRSVTRSPLLPPLEITSQPERTSMGWEVYPDGLTDVLEFVASRTGEIALFVSESGAAYPANPDDPTTDPNRVNYLKQHLLAAHAAVECGVPLAGYFVWSLLDNFEWAEGYAQRFGIIHVDFETLERRVKDSGRLWAAVARSGSPDPEGFEMAAPP